MASILKVDTLQKPDGSTPTAADLGIDVAGSVVQVQQQTKRNAQAFNVSTWADVSTLYVDFTPKYADSTIQVTVHMFTGANAGNSAQWRVVRDGAEVTAGVGIGASSHNAMGGHYSESGSSMQYAYNGNSNTFMVAANSLATTRFQVQIRGWDSSQTCYVNRRGNDVGVVGISSITVTEIKN